MLKRKHLNLTLMFKALGGELACFGKWCPERGKRLRKIPLFTQDGIEGMEQFMQFDDAVLHHSNGVASQVCGNYACSTCTYLVTEGKAGSTPTCDISPLENVSLRCLVRCLCLQPGDDGFIVLESADIGCSISNIARKLRSECITPFLTKRCVRMPFVGAVRCFEDLKIKEGK